MIQDAQTPASQWGIKNDLPFLFSLLGLMTVVSILFWWISGWNTLLGGMSRMPNAVYFLENGKLIDPLGPITTVYYAFWMIFFGKTVMATKIASLIAFMAFVMIFYKIACLLFENRWAARLSAVVLATSPFLYRETTTAAWELPSIFILCCYLLFALQLYRKGDLCYAVGLGLTSGFGPLVKGALIPLGFTTLLYFGILGFTGRSGKSLIKPIVLSTLLCFAIILSFMTRNLIREGYFSLSDPVYSATTFYHGNNPRAYKGFPQFDDQYQVLSEQIEKSVPGGDRIALAKAYKRAAWDYILSDPFSHIVVVGFKKIWCGFKFYGREEILHWGPLVPLAFFGLWTLARQGKYTLIVHLVFLQYMFVAFVFFGFSRYRHAYMPIFVLLATSAIFWLWNRFRNRTFYWIMTAYLLVFPIAYFFAKPLRALWLYYIPQLRM